MPQLLECLLSFFSHIQNTLISNIIPPIIYHEKNTKNTTAVYKMRKSNQSYHFALDVGVKKRIYLYVCVCPFQGLLKRIILANVTANWITVRKTS